MAFARWSEAGVPLGGLVLEHMESCMYQYWAQLAEVARMEGIQVVAFQWHVEENLAGVADHESDVALACTGAAALGACLEASDGSSGSREGPSSLGRMDDLASCVEGGRPGVFADDAYGPA